MKEVKKTRSLPSREAARAQNGVRHRKRRKRSYALYYILVLFFVLISGITLSVTVFFNIDTILVSGSELHTTEEIIAACGIQKGNNLFRISPDKAEKKLITAFTDMDAVRVKRKFPNSLVITVTDALPTYYIEDSTGYTAVSAGGRVLQKNVPEEDTFDGIKLKGVSSETMEVGIFISQSEDEKYKNLQTLIEVLEENNLQDITMIDLSNSVDLVMEYQDRLRIKLGSMSELSYKVNFVKNVIETKLQPEEEGIIDATQPGKISYSPGEASSEVLSSSEAGSTVSEGNDSVASSGMESTAGTPSDSTSE